MANTYTQIYIHSVFAVRNRDFAISKKWNNELYKYITGIVQNLGNKMLAINGMPDHVHMLIGLNSQQAVSKLLQEVKANSSKWINESSFFKGRFSWQEGFGAFSYSHSQLDTVIKYIQKQQEHHKKKTFREEYLEFLEKFKVDFDKRYLFDFY